MRTVAMIMNLASVITVVSLIANGTESINYPKGLITAPIILMVFMIFILKAEYDKLDEYRYHFLLGNLILSIVLIAAIGYGTSSELANINFIIWQYYLPMLISIFFLIICWHYTLTIYKDEMKRHLIGYVVFMILYIVFGITPIGLLILIPVLLTSIAVFMNQYAVSELKKKKLLKIIG